MKQIIEHCPRVFFLLVVLSSGAAFIASYAVSIYAEENTPHPGRYEESIELDRKAQSKWRILIVAEKDGFGLRAGHPAYKRVNNAIFTQLQRAGFDVLSLAADEGLPACLMDICEGKTEQDIIGLAKASPSNIDLVILYSIRYVERIGAATVHREISVPSRMVDVQSGRRIGLWDDDGFKVHPIPEDCVQGCLQKRLSDSARQIGRDSGLAIAVKLQGYQRWFDYHLTFLKFARGELLTVERFLKRQEKGSELRDIHEGKDGASDANRELLHYIVDKKIVYESTLSPLDFRERLEEVLDAEGIRAKIQVSGRDFQLTREGIPYLMRYALLLLVFLVILFWLYRRYSVYKYRNISRRLEAMRAVLQREIDCEKASRLNSPANNPYNLLMKVQYLLDDTLSLESVGKQRAALITERHKFIEQLPKLAGMAVLTTITATTAPLARGKKTVNLLIDDSVDIGRGNFASLNKETVQKAAIPIDFKRLSLAGRQNKIERRDGVFSIVDEGSTNGSWLDAMEMPVGKPMSLSNSHHVLRIGGSKQPKEPGLCHMNLYLPESAVGSMVLEIDSAAIALTDQSYVAENWPNCGFDQTQQWVLLGKALGVGIDDSGQLDVGCLRGSLPLLELSFSNGICSKGGGGERSSRHPGYWIEPIARASKSVDLQVNGVFITSAVPLVPGAEISLDNRNVSFSFQDTDAFKKSS